MFGAVIADPSHLEPEQRLRYQSCYCGLCRALGDQFSQASRLTLNYDMTFLVLLLHSLYEPEETAGQGRCLVHPWKPRPYWRGPWTDYGAAMNVILSYYKCLDDWRDDRSLLKLAQSRLFRGACQEAERAYPRQARAVTENLAALSELESAGVQDPDAAANCFASLMGELFVPDPGDHWAGDLRTLGEGLGRFVYLLDAAVDLPEDRRRGQYNPLSAMAADGRGLEDFHDDLSVLIGEGAAAFERLPLVQDTDLLRNILYAGVWIPYHRALQRQAEQEKGDST